MKGWFDAFREEGGPTLYAYHNRTAVAADVPALALLLAALTLYLAFLVVFPGIRKERFSTFTVVTLSLFVGTVILVCKHGSSWHIAGARVARAAYRAFSSERLDCWLAIHVGLGHVNVTLTALSWGNTTIGDPGVDYNEQFRWEEAGAIQEWYRAGLTRGLPYPVLSVAEHFAVQHEGFEWGAKYRAAGYTTSTLLCISTMASNESAPSGCPSLWCIRNGDPRCDIVRCCGRLLGLSAKRSLSSQIRRSDAVLLARLVLLASPNSR